MVRRGGMHSERMERELITGMWGICHHHGPGAESLESLVRGHMAKPPEAERLLDFGGSKEWQTMHTYCLLTVHSESLLKMEIG